MQAKTSIYVLEGSKENRFVLLNQEDKSFNLQVQGMTINYCFPSGKWDHGTIILFYEPKSRLFGWYLVTIYSGEKTDHSYSKEQINRFVEENRVYLLNGKIILFIPRLHTEIWFREFQEPYPSLAEARQQLLLTLEVRLEEIERRWLDDVWYRKISIQKYLNYRFWRSREQRIFRDGWVKLTEVTYQNSQWRLELDSVDENHPITHKYGTVILDDDYNVIEVLGDAKKPEGENLFESS